MTTQIRFHCVVSHIHTIRQDYTARAALNVLKRMAKEAATAIFAKRKMFQYFSNKSN